MSRDTESRIWLGWLTAVACSLAALEMALSVKLCTVLRRLLRVEPQRPGHRVLGSGLVITLAWLASHILDRRRHE